MYYLRNIGMNFDFVIFTNTMPISQILKIYLVIFIHIIIDLCTINHRDYGNPLNRVKIII